MIINIINTILPVALAFALCYGALKLGRHLAYRHTMEKEENDFREMCIEAFKDESKKAGALIHWLTAYEHCPEHTHRVQERIEYYLKNLNYYLKQMDK